MIQQPVDVHGTAGHGKAHTERDELKYRGTDIIQQLWMYTALLVMARHTQNMMN